MDEFLHKLFHEFQTPFKNSVLVFSVILFIILLAPILLRRLRIPGIIGLILSGIAIGPHGFYLLEKNSAVNLFSTIGLLYIMFIAGLELDLGEFKKNQNKSFVFGILTFILPLTIGLPVCYYLLGYSFITSLLTASMFATHTLIAYPIVSRLGISKNEAVAVTVGGTILTDTAVLVILAVISGAASGGLTTQLWIRLGVSFAVFLFIVAFIIPKASAWFFKRFEDEKNAHFIFVLSVVFFCAFLAELSGLEPIIGAFAAGLTLNRLIPHTSALMNRVEFVGNSLFIPFFLISVGMMIDVKVLGEGTGALWVALALTVVALLGKWLASFLTGVIFKYTKAQRNLVFGLSSAHAAATLAIILVGFNLGIIDDKILNGTIVLILVTCLIASFVTEEAGRKVVLESEAMVPDILLERNQRILVPVSNPTTMEKLLDFSIMIKDPKDDSPITGLTVVEDNDQAHGKLLQAKKLLNKAILHAAAVDQKVEITATIDQNVSNGIRRVTREMFITDIVLGWSVKSKFADLLFGKTFDSLISQTTQHLFLGRFTLPLNVHKSLHLVCPPFADREDGFREIINRFLRLARQLSTGIVIHSTEETYSEVQNIVFSQKSSVIIQSHPLKDLKSLLKKGIKIHMNDLVVIVLSRKGNISYEQYFETLPERVVKSLHENSIVFVYPKTKLLEGTDSYTVETDGGLLEKGINLLKGAQGIFIKK